MFPGTLYIQFPIGKYMHDHENKLKIELNVCVLPSLIFNDDVRKQAKQGKLHQNLRYTLRFLFFLFFPVSLNAYKVFRFTSIIRQIYPE